LNISTAPAIGREGEEEVIKYQTDLEVKSQWLLLLQSSPHSVGLLLHWTSRHLPRDIVNQLPLRHPPPLSPHGHHELNVLSSRVTPLLPACEDEWRRRRKQKRV
jgi:hypothetical protein